MNRIQKTLIRNISPFDLISIKTHLENQIANSYIITL